MAYLKRKWKLLGYILWLHRDGNYYSILGYILGLYRDNGTENGNYPQYDGVYIEVI